MIDIRKLKELVRLMVENELTELDLHDQTETVSIKRGNEAGTVVNHQPVIYQGGGAPAVAAPVHAAAPAAAAPAAANSTPAGDDDAGLVAIESPMVGTFYMKPNPDSDNFTSIGASVGPDSVVCLVEAMKVFNEIKAETSGTIAKICVNDGDAVEFGQKLFLVKPN
ncbi:MAG: acetyl-CoA carboxylase biotin carboxyl carrier protein [Phycisphaerales bacterium]|nr:acetyl-CoA carboxylase biotin carboxyl carrier protein [Phycisphaerales bacterium]